MTMAPQRPRKPRAGRRPVDPGPPTFMEWLNGLATICGVCFGHREVWCPDCGGFEGCSTCGFSEKVRCPECAGGKLDGYHW